MGRPSSDEADQAMSRDSYLGFGGMATKEDKNEALKAGKIAKTFLRRSR